jgi:hypothetical protein
VSRQLTGQDPAPATPAPMPIGPGGPGGPFLRDKGVDSDVMGDATAAVATTALTTAIVKRIFASRDSVVSSDRGAFYKRKRVLMFSCFLGFDSY